ncbi:MAG: peptidoglycan editing factor PgeF [Nitrospiria bacterium]
MLAKAQRQGYQWVQNNGKGYLQLPLLNHPNAFHLFGTRLLSPKTLENSHVPIRLRQVHGDYIQSVNASQDALLFEAIPGDALITDAPRRLITVGTADCTPILLLDPVKKVCAAVHAGWRGSVLDIAGKTVRKMISDYHAKPENIFAGIGPTIHPCCFEVGPDVVEAVSQNTPYGDWVFSQKETRQGIEKQRLDLVRLNRLQLIDAGVPANQIETAGLCTHCLPNLFYSFRRDRRKLGNMVSGIMLI